MWLGTVTTKEKKRGSKDRMSSKKNETTDDIWRKAERIMEAVPKKAPLIPMVNIRTLRNSRNLLPLFWAFPVFVSFKVPSESPVFRPPARYPRYRGTSGSTQGEKKLNIPCINTVIADTPVSIVKPIIFLLTCYFFNCAVLVLSDDQQFTT